ncbi:MAG: TlpA disulfide reductase family protein [Bacteroidota bacterium]|nr:TlpA disulfide reductase family protein [Bacteroidota bacterium]
MKKIAYLQLLLLAVLPLLSFSQQKGGYDFTITGNIKGLGNDSVIIYVRNYYKGGELKIDTLITIGKSDKFFIKGHTDAVHDAAVMIGGFRARKSFTLFTEKGNINVKGHRDSLDFVTISGTKGNEEYSSYKKIEDNIYRQIRELQTQYKAVGDNKAEADRLSNEMDVCRDSIRAGRVSYIAEHPGSPASAIYLYVLQDHVSVEELEKLYTNLTRGVKNISYVRLIPQKIEARKRSAVGMPAPDFVSKDTSGNLVRLSDFKGKYVLLEFWANWCVPCRAQHPHLAEMYKKYGDKGFTILQYSVDEQNAADKWKAAIVKDKLVWTQASDLMGLGSMVAKTYGVQPIPDNFLIDPSGKIIGRRLEGKELEKILAELLDK